MDVNDGGSWGSPNKSACVRLDHLVMVSNNHLFSFLLYKEQLTVTEGALHFRQKETYFQPELPNRLQN